MSYGMVRRPAAGIGEQFVATISTPVGDQNVKVNLPYEALLQKAIEEAAKQGQAAALPILQSLLPQIMAMALPIAGDYIEHTFWPDTMKPLVEAEVKKTMNEAKKTASIAGGIMILAMFGAAFFVIRRRG